jgi:hypothetical protein
MISQVMISLRKDKKLLMQWPKEFQMNSEKNSIVN